MSVTRYPAYKDSGVEWLGRVPAHWGVMPLKHLVEMRSGEAITAEDISDAGEYPVFGGNGLRGYTSRFTHEGQYALVGRQGALCGNVNYASGRFWASEHAVVCTPRRPIAVRWLGELLRAMNLGQYSIAAAQPGLSVDLVSRIRVPVPPDAEARTIAAFLDGEIEKIDALVAEQERLIDLLREKRQAVLSHSVTKGLKPNAPFKNSGIEWLDTIPGHWRVAQVKHLARAGAKTFTDGDWVEAPFITTEGVRLLQTGNVGIGVFKEQGFRYVSAATFAEFGCTEVEPRDVLICRLDGPVGRACLAPELGVRMITSVDNAILKVADDVDAEFIVALMSSVPWLSWIDALCRVGGGFRLRISRSQLGELRIPLPPIREQRAISARLRDEAERSKPLLDEARRAIDLLQERRAALISAAVTGQIDVRDAAARSAA